MRQINMESNRSIDRAFDVLQVFTIERPSLTKEEISKLTDIPVSTVYRILYTLERRSLVRFDPDTLCYSPGFRLIEFGSLISSILDVHREAESFLNDLHVQTRQTVLMAISDGDQILYVFNKENYDGLKFSSHVGQRRPYIYGILGPVLLSYLPNKQIERILEIPVPKHTPYTTTDPDLIRKRLQLIKDNGFYIESDETNIGVTGIGAPVFDVRKEVIAAVGVIGPSVQLVGEVLEQAKVALLTATQGISSKMGYPGKLHSTF
ncbi:IclR family transcriptional regulator [Paenibacillus piri]|uniref:IclR family transcriptional regulator n=1 Tax=Paenibacillus piri TaxID=2547395 RepID=A0A4R5KD13_9BACL|nr:IclR family transcriptional regulator [Paenibacillus piri]TDF93229.1 IclR family transcriptional regulator [Paenibacillus piri]